MGFQCSAAWVNVVRSGARGRSGEEFYRIELKLNEELLQVNETYVGVLKDIVSGLADNGIYSYLDMHQVSVF